MPNDSVMTVPHELLILGAAVKTGIIEAINRKPLTIEELAREIGADERALWVVTEALATLGYLNKTRGRLQLTGEAVNMFYKPDAPNYTGFSFMHRYNIINSWMLLPEVISSGQPRPRERSPDNMKYFMGAMSCGSRLSAPEVAGFCLADSGSGKKVLDIGGGPLTYARAFAEKGAFVIVLDLPEVVEYMKPALGEVKGIEMVPGDFNIGLPQGPFDLAFLGNICHIYGENENRALFKRIAAVLVKDGRIAVVDFIRGTNPFAAVFGVNMLVSTKNGGTWTLEQYTEWLTAAGFSNVELGEAGGRQVILAKKREWS